MNKRPNGLIALPLHVDAGFTGTMVIQVENGTAKAQFPLRDGEFFGSMDTFLTAARMAGYQVIPPAA